MAHINTNQEEGTITLDEFTIKNADFFAIVSAESQESREQLVLDVIAVGSAAMQRVRSTIDVDFVEKRFGTLAGIFEKTLGQLEVRAVDAVTQRFSPTTSGSYTKQIGELIAEAKRDVLAWNKQVETNAHALLDPDLKSSATGKLGELIEEATGQFKDMFDPNVRTSYSSRLNEQLAQLFGTDGRAGALQDALKKALTPVFSELQEVKEKIEAKKAAEVVVESSTLKGKPFEDTIQNELCRLAQPHGDDVSLVATGSNGSRAGDFIVSFNGLGKSAVVEARNRRQISLPAIKSELDREMAERGVDLAIYVSSGAEMLPQHVGRFQIYGNKIVTTADSLHIAYRLARVLATLRAPDGALDVGALRSILAKIKDAAHAMRQIKSKATQVEKFAKGINEDANGAEGGILALIEDAEKLLETSQLAQTA
jgi:hypothetical protein